MQTEVKRISADEPLPYNNVQMIAEGLQIPSRAAWISLAREVLKKRDAVDEFNPNEDDGRDARDFGFERRGDLTPGLTFSDPVPVGGAVLPSEVQECDWKQAYDLLGYTGIRDELHDFGAKVVAMRCSLCRQLAEAIAQRDRLQDALVNEQGNTCRLGFEVRKAEAALATERKDKAQLQYALEQSESKFTTERARVLQEATEHIDALRTKLEFPTKFSSGRDSGIEDSHAAIRALLKK